MSLAPAQVRRVHMFVSVSFVNLLSVSMLELILGSLGVPVTVVFVEASGVINEIVDDFGPSEDTDKLCGSINVDESVRWMVNINSSDSSGELLSSGARKRLRAPEGQQASLEALADVENWVIPNNSQNRVWELDRAIALGSQGSPANG